MINFECDNEIKTDFSFNTQGSPKIFQGSLKTPSILQGTPSGFIPIISTVLANFWKSLSYGRCKVFEDVIK